MHLFFTSSALHEACSRRQAMNRRWGDRGGSVIAQLLQDLDAAEELGHLESLPYLRLEAKRNGELMIEHDEAGVSIRIRPRATGGGARTNDTWRDSTEALVLEVIVAEA